MRNVHGLMVLCVGFALLCASGCVDGGDEGSSGSNGNGGFDSGLPGDKQLSELTAEEAVSACERVASELGAALNNEDVTRAVCTGESLEENLIQSSDGQTTLDVSGCEASVSQCVADADTELDLGAIECGDGTEVIADLTSCSATVDDFERCMSAAITESNRIFGLLSCSALGRPGALEDFAEMQEQGGGFDIFGVAGCDEARRQCPDLGLFDLE